MKVSKRTTGVAIIVVVLTGISIVVSLRTTPSEACTIWIDAARPVSIEPPFEIVEIGENGELGLWLPAQEGHGWKGEAGGEAIYQFYAPVSGAYTVWAYCLWHDACTNAIYAQFDDLDKAVLGNDPEYEKWHWVKGFEVPLEKGLHQLRLANHSSNIAVQRVFLTNDALMTPPNVDTMAGTILFRDDFNGCDRGNFPLWRHVAGKWEVDEPENLKSDADNVLVGTSDEKAVITYDNYTWNGIRMKVSVFSDSPSEPDAAIGIRFGIVDDKNYQEIRLTLLPDGEEAIASHVQYKFGQAKTLAQGKVPWQQGNWHELYLDATQSKPTLLLNGGALFTGGHGEEVRGGIGFALYGDIQASFDNVLIQTESNNK